MKRYDFIIVGAGIVGAATAYALIQKYPDKKILVVDKEKQCASHQTGRNSGVIHAGVYYAPGSLKAQYCKEGLKRTIEFCKQHDLPYEQCGKLLVATTPQELKCMQDLYSRCQQNQIECSLLDQTQLQKREPNIVGLGAIFVKDTGITNYTLITSTLLNLFKNQGGDVQFSCPIEYAKETSLGITLGNNANQFDCGFFINCAGIYADTIAKKLGLSFDFQLLPFRGEYFRLPEKYNKIVNHLIYPIPDPDLPFLGVHLTKMIDGSVTVGPNAVLALGKEAYAKTNINFKELWNTIKFKGFMPMTKAHLKSGLAEQRDSIFTQGYLRKVQKYCPDIQKQDLLAYPSGIRAQAVKEDGTLIHDFCFLHSPRSLHIGNAPSPAATSAMPIADAIVEKVLKALG
ncbi:L-2-hydroxyglutarate oxidase [Paraglaciecola aquimarina]|uniref:L-2-hydroxyglutarate oxidase n=1 Tax=Paraglaciecola algarum TaxID=3050085 RepID=A0ABS9DCF9_9ALTE|nr:L-2-hydroxyglutarate oxidase [Paraglaciecola sp. G1-23]MCF2949479.1 L-2-hydroxyglutarate oxidase [Paraglaciecola sp. G1-23]